MEFLFYVKTQNYLRGCAAKINPSFIIMAKIYLLLGNIKTKKRAFTHTKAM